MASSSSSTSSPKRLEFSADAQPFASIPLIAKAFEKLNRELSFKLPYHNMNHVTDVFNEAIAFAIEDHLDKRSIELLSIAAVFHDLGFIERNHDNESIGAAAAIDAMKADGGFSTAEIELVSTMIMDTQLKPTPDGLMQIPTTHLSKYLCDADVSNLGRKDFFDKSEIFRSEIGENDRSVFAERVKKHLAIHRWNTPAARRLRQKQKDLNLIELNRRFPG